MTTTTEVTALEAERAALEEAERARRTQLESRREIAQSTIDFVAAEAAREAAVAGGVKGERDADKRMDSAMEAIRSAANRRASAEERERVSEKVHRSASARIDQVRVTLLDELSEDCAEFVNEFEQAQAELEPVLRRYVSTYNAARRRWDELKVGTVARVQELDRERGYDRSDAKVQAEASPPPCPVSPALLTLILGLSPKPPVAFDNYEPDGPLSRYLGKSKPEADPLAEPEIQFRWRADGSPNPAYEVRSRDGQTLHHG